MNVRDKKIGAWLWWAFGIVAFLALIAQGLIMADRTGHGLGVGDGHLRDEPTTQPGPGGR